MIMTVVDHVVGVFLVVQSVRTTRKVAKEGRTTRAHTSKSLAQHRQITGWGVTRND